MRRKHSFMSSTLFMNFSLKGLVKRRYMIMRMDKEASKMV